MPSLDNRFWDFLPEDLEQQRVSLEDAYYLPGFLCKKQDTSLFHQLQKELSFQEAWLDSGLPFSRHLCLVSDELLEQKAPTLHAILEHLAEVFNLQPVRCLLSLYRHGGDFCNLHMDEYNGNENFSIGISFGEERQLLFEEKGTKAQFAIPQRNGDVHAYGKVCNTAWNHGVPPSLDVEEASIFVVLLGQRGAGPIELPISLSGTFPQILFHDPTAGSEPRRCEVCKRMAEPGGGRSDLDGHWSCRKCVLRMELMGWRPCAASSSMEVTDGITVRRAQQALAILVGESVFLWRRASFPDGWYALHVAKEGVDADAHTSLDNVTIDLPKETDLPHHAVVGLLCLQRDRLAVAKQDHWQGPLQKYKITKTLPLKDPWPTRSPGIPEAPWRLSMISRKAVLELAANMKVLENLHESEPEKQQTWDNSWSSWRWWNGWDDWSGGWKSWHWNDSWEDWSWHDRGYPD